jgi:hypothetical protein
MKARDGRTPSQDFDWIINMTGRSNRRNVKWFFPRSEHDELQYRLRALHHTIKTTPAAPEDDIAAIDNSEADFMHDAQVIEEELALARARFDANYRRRRPNVGVTNFYPFRNGRGLYRKANGDVHAFEYDPFFAACLARMCGLLALSATVLLCMATESLFSWFGEYELHVKWTSFGLFLGISTRALGGVLVALYIFAAAPLATLKSIFNDELSFQARLIHEAGLSHSLQGDREGPNFQTMSYVFLPAAAYVESKAYHLAGVDICFGPCAAYSSWLTFLATLTFIWQLGMLLCRWVMVLYRLANALIR